MSTEIPVYAFDPDGTLPANLVSEQQSIQSNDVFDYFYIIPKAAPFFAGSVKLKLFPSGRVLQEGVDYNFGHHFMAASHTIGLPIYGSISFYDHTLAGIVLVEYQTLGGIWTLDADAILEILANESRNPRITSWDTIVELPSQFPAINHSFDIDDFVGMSEVTDSLEGIKEAIESSGQGGIQGHINNKNNPHETTKSHVGLGLVDNFPTAAPAEATAGISNSRFMTPLRTMQLITATATVALDLHLANLNNPHQTTKAHVGLGSVQNYAMASQAEAEAGSSNARYSSPLRVREAIDAIVGVILTGHMDDHDNPHQTTKAHVGLGSVQNYSIASVAEAQNATATDKYMTPALTRATITAMVGTGFDGHVNNFANPHQTTQAHVGLGSVQNFGIATEAEARDATLNNRYMTPLAVRYTINELVGEISGGHASDFNNPHQVSAFQVGLGNVQNFGIASEVEARAAVAVNRYMTPLAVRQAIDELVVNSFTTHTEDFNNPHNVTAALIGAVSSAEFNMAIANKLDISASAFNTLGLFGRNEAETISWISTLTAADSALLQGRDFATVMVEVLTGKAADSELFDGKTYDEVFVEVSSRIDKSSIQSEIIANTTVNDGGVQVVPPEHWSMFGTIRPGVDGYYADTTLLLTGGRNPAGVGPSGIQTTALLTIGAEFVAPPNGSDVRVYTRAVELRYLNNGPDPFTIGYVEVVANNASVTNLYVLNNGVRNRITATDLTGQSFTAVDMQVPVNISDINTSTPSDLRIITPTKDGTDDFETARTAFATFAARTDNPHTVTKAQVGLSLVSNYADASNADALAGTAANKFMTPVRTKEAIDATAEEILSEVTLTLDAIIASFA